MDLAGCSEISINTRFVIAICRIEIIEKKLFPSIPRFIRRFIV